MAAIRPARFPNDSVQLRALDRSFTTDRVYRIARTPWSFTLEEVPIQPPLRKDFPLEGDLAEGREWEHCLVAESEGEVVGFAAFAHGRWNRRTELWHLYVGSSHRGQGIGRALIDAVLADARAAGMRCVWLETSTVAYPAIAFYRQVGFELCGLDTSLYDPDRMPTQEAALYFARPL